MLLAPLLQLGTLLVNGGFEDGLHGWDVSCALPRCGEVKAETGHAHSGARFASLQATEDDWTAVQLRQTLSSPLPSGALTLEAWVRAAPSSWFKPPAALEFQLELQFEGHGSCRTELSELPADWERVRVSCVPPADARRAWAVVHYACVRGSSTLLADDVRVAVGSDTPASELRAAGMPKSVPRIVHFVFGLSQNFGGKPFGLAHHLVILAALRSVRPTTAYFHFAYQPSGTWWERAKGSLTLRRVKPPKSIFGRPIKGFAHSADVLRLELLQQFGGIYLDLDIMLLRPLDTLLDGPHELVLAHEGIDGTIGAANALMLARRNASILAEWYGRYRSFSDRVWNGFSVRLPMELSLSFPGKIRLLNYTAFYWPPWNPWGVAQLYRSARCLMPSSLAVHLWETKMWSSLLAALQPAALASRRTCFQRIGHAVLNGSYDFADATLRAGEAAEEADTLLLASSLSEQLAAEASQLPEPAAAERPRELPTSLARFRGPTPTELCDDSATECHEWAKGGGCEKNAPFMLRACARSCGACR